MMAAVQSGISTTSEWDKTDQLAAATYEPNPEDYGAYRQARRQQDSLERLLTEWGAFA